MFVLVDCFVNVEILEDKYWLSVIILLMFVLGRVGELLELIVDCLYWGENGVFGVRWYVEKGFGYMIKWVLEVLE